MIKPVVAIIGRPNVGKSTLFNRLTGEKKAIVDNFPGVTRDRNYSDCTWLRYSFILIDTGGFTDDDDQILSATQKQALFAIEEADVVVFLTDGREGVNPDDHELANILRKTNKPVILAVNKMERNEMPHEFYVLGLGDPLPISAEHGLNTGELLDRIVKHFPIPEEDEKKDAELLKIAIAGRPNVGKSSLLNSLLGEERVIVSDIPGTTRDAVDTYFSHHAKNYLFIDTAGIRKKARVNWGIERFGVIRALRAIDRSDIVLLVMDAKEGVSEQDVRIAGYIHEAGKAQIFVINKWDLYKGDERHRASIDEQLKMQASFLSYVPVVYISAKTKHNLGALLKNIDFVGEQYRQRIPTSRLNEVIQEAVMRHEPPSFKGKKMRIYHAMQPQASPPVILLYVNQTNLMHFSYERYLENKIREAFGFNGSPLRIVLKTSK